MLTQACELECDHRRVDVQPRRHPEELTTAGGERFPNCAADFGDAQLVVSGGNPGKRPDLDHLVA